ncbi:hypothetical protein FSP39_012473 [Pinctada imbricata]|uniref:Uncharacterized protein n=1 Tax=Pinctada imbricata TaxID=66713 RepID=A0AA88YNZ9_PINIB|nr:hypothetical protein FSP39_012473 [Pinctada imbricata]
MQVLRMRWLKAVDWLSTMLRFRLVTIGSYPRYKKFDDSDAFSMVVLSTFDPSNFVYYVNIKAPAILAQQTFENYVLILLNAGSGNSLNKTWHNDSDQRFQSGYKKTRYEVFHTTENYRSSLIDEWNLNPPSKDETWIHHLTSAGNVMASVFWEADGVLLIDFLQKGQTINDTYYASLLTQLQESIKIKRRGKLTKGVLFLPDNLLFTSLLLP